MNDSGMVALISQTVLDAGFGRLALQIPQSAIERPIPMKRLLFLAMTLLLLSPFRALASPCCDFEIIAQTGVPLPGTSLTLSAFKSEGSINDNGTVAFIGVFPNGQGVFRKKPGQPIELLTPNDVSTSKEFGSVWVNDTDQVATTVLQPGAFTVDQVRRYEAGNASLLPGLRCSREGWCCPRCLWKSEIPLRQHLRLREHERLGPGNVLRSLSLHHLAVLILALVAAVVR
jgi:hypothetical protein